MRDIVLVLALIAGLGVTFRYPFAGVLLWAWFTIQQPQQEAYGFAKSLPLNLILAVVTLLSLMFSKERKSLRMDMSFWLIIIFLFWMTINAVFAVDPGTSWGLWDRAWKIIVFGVLVGITANSKVRIHALIWAVTISLLYYGIKGGLFTILSGGHNHVLGPQHSAIRDNNELALALLMIMPLANYLRLYSANRFIRLGFAASLVLTTISILGSYSRGAYLAMAGLVVVAWWRSRNKFIYPIAAAAVIIPGLYLMPQSFYDRIASINNIDTDQSVQGRFTAWQVAFHAAVDHFPLGVGFSGADDPRIFNHYFPGAVTHVAHSIYFQVLGDHGFIGLAIYLCILALAFWNTFQIMKVTKGKLEFAWARDLAAMIQLSLLAFCTGGAALSVAYYDLFIIYIGLLPAIRELVSQPAATRKVVAAHAFAPAAE